MREQAGRCGLGEHWPPLRLPPETVVSADPDERRRSARGGPSACMHTHWKLAGTAGRATSPPCLHERARSAPGRTLPPVRLCAAACGDPGGPPTVAAHSCTARRPYSRAHACMLWIRPSFRRAERLRLRASTHARTHACTCRPAALPARVAGGGCACGLPTGRAKQAIVHGWTDGGGPQPAAARVGHLAKRGSGLA